MKKQIDLLNGDVKKSFFHYLVPSISATLVTSIYILADTIMIGRGVGPIGIAALNLLLPVYSLFFGTGVLFGVGGSVFFSVARGKGEERTAREYFTAALKGVIIASLFYEIVFLLFFDSVTLFLGKTQQMEPLVNEYGKILVSGAPVFLFSSFLQAFVRNDKSPRTAMAAVITGGVTNVALDYVFIFPMGMGMAGGAIATVIGSAVTVAILCSHFFSPHNMLRPVRQVSMRKTGEAFVSGLSSFMIELSSGIVIFMFNRQLLYWIGELGVVVYGIISNSALIVNSVCNGIAQAAQPIMAVNFGAGKKDRVERTRKLGLLAAFTAGILFAASGILNPSIIIYTFVKPTEEIMALAPTAVRLYFFSFLAVGANLLFSTYFQSVLRPGAAFFLSLMRGAVLNGLFIVILPLIFGVDGIWATMIFTEFATILAAVYLFTKNKTFKEGQLLK